MGDSSTAMTTAPFRAGIRDLLSPAPEQSRAGGSVEMPLATQLVRQHEETLTKAEALLAKASTIVVTPLGSVMEVFDNTIMAVYSGTVAESSHVSIRAHSHGGIIGHGAIQALSWKCSDPVLARSQHHGGTIPAPSWHDSSTIMALFKHHHGTIQAPSWHYSSPVMALFKHRHGTIQAPS